MTLNELRYIVAVAHERNFRRAAEHCFVSQPALSLAVKKLEGELGVALFERNRNDVTLTPTGERIVEQAARVLDEVTHIYDIAKQGTDQLAGSLHVGAIHTIGPYLLPSLISVLNQTISTMPLEVEENTTANLEMQLRNGAIDAAIIALPFNVPGVITEALYDEAFVVAMPHNHPWATRDYITANDLSAEKVLLLNSEHCFSNQVVEACPELSRKGEVQQGNSLETIRNMVASGLGISVLPCSAATEHYRNPLIQTVPFLAPAPSRRVAIAYRRSFVRPQAIVALIDAIQKIDAPCFQHIQ